MNSSLTFKRLREANLKRCESWHPGGVTDWSLSDWAVALTGELGEACDIIKKLNRVRDEIVGNKLSEDELKVELKKELADTMIYLDLLAARAEIDLADVVIDKFNEVSVRIGLPNRLAKQALAEGEMKTQLLIGCQIEDCASEVSYPIGMMKLFDFKPICQECFNFENETTTDWSELPDISREDLDL